MGYFRRAVDCGPCCVMHPCINWLTVSDVNKCQFLMVIILSLRKYDVVRFDITMRNLIYGVQIKKGIT